MKKKISKKQKRKTYKKKRSYKSKGGNNKIEDIALIIPIHSKHYSDIYKFIDKLKLSNYQIDLYLVFSNNDEYQTFNYKEHIKPIIITEPINNTKGIITFKKFYGLKHLINSNYNYFIVCDSESDIVTENFTHTNITEKINAIFNNKIVYGGKTNTEGFINIMKTSSNLFLPDEQNILKNATEDFTIYTWWSDLPVYKKEHLNDFFNKINYDNIIFEHFDYIIYQYYLILKYNFKLINTDTGIILFYPVFSSVEDDMNQLNKLKELKYGFSFIPALIYNRNKQFLIDNGTFLISNLDRQ